jgi:hypothetical protein
MLMPEDLLHDPGMWSIGYHEYRNRKYILSKRGMQRHKQVELTVNDTMLPRLNYIMIPCI